MAWLADLWAWLNDNQGALATLTTVILVALTWLNVRVARRSAVAAASSAEGTLRSAESSEHLLQLESLPVVLGGIEGADFAPSHFVIFNAVNVGRGVAVNPECSLKAADDLLGSVAMPHLQPLAEHGDVRMAVSQPMFNAVGSNTYWVVVEYQDALARKYRTERDAFGTFSIIELSDDGTERTVLGT